MLGLRKNSKQPVSVDGAGKATGRCPWEGATTRKVRRRRRGYSCEGKGRGPCNSSWTFRRIAGGHHLEQQGGVGDRSRGAGHGGMELMRRAMGRR
jgi:hypothetical protein